MITIKESITNALKEENKLLKSKVLNLEHSLSQSEARINVYINTIREMTLKFKAFPLMSLMTHWKIK